MNKQIRKAGFFICLTIFLGAGSAYIGKKVATNYREKHLEKIVQSAVTDSAMDEETTDQGTEPLDGTSSEETTEKGTPKAETEPLPTPEAEKPDIPIDFEYLWEENPDVYAWIRIPDTPVDYPILQSEPSDPDYYLEHNIDGSEGYPSCIYTQSLYANKEFTDALTVIYGHSMKDETMFGCLKHYRDSEYRSAHPQILVYTPEKILTYNIVFTVTYPNVLIPFMYDCSSKVEYQQFIDSVLAQRELGNWIKDPWMITTEDRIIALSTCTGVDEQRFLVGAVLEDVQGE